MHQNSQRSTLSRNNGVGTSHTDDRPPSRVTRAVDLVHRAGRRCMLEALSRASGHTRLMESMTMGGHTTSRNAFFLCAFVFVWIAFGV